MVWPCRKGLRFVGYNTHCIRIDLAMKSHIYPLLTGLAVAFLLCGSYLTAATPELATQFDFSSDTTPGARKFIYETIPGHRYTLWRSTDLLDWDPVPGYPQTAAGLSIEHTFAQDTKEFFRVEPIDDQAPVVEAQYPSVDGFAVGRFADLSIELTDATGIDPASIRLTVGGTGPLAPGAMGLTISGNTITYDSGDAALGAWDATLSATLVVSDNLGHTLTHTWSFRLEPEPQVAANIFVFGSPVAQRSGQRVSGPAAVLASRFLAPVGPVRANAPAPWEIDAVLADRIVIAYEAGGAPSFAAGQLICNLAPTKESEIFYRRVVSTSHDAVNSKLTVMTEDAVLTDFILQGAISFSENSVIYELDGNGNLVRARSDTFRFQRLGVDLSGSSIKLRQAAGYDITLANLGSYSSGVGSEWLDLSLPEFSWWLTPEIRAGLEFDLGGLKSFEAVASGQLSVAMKLDADVVASGASTTTTLFDLPEHLEPKQLIAIGVIAGIPISASVGFDFSVETKAEAKALLEFSATCKHEAKVSFGLEYHRGSPIDWVRSFEYASPDLAGSAGLAGEFSLELSMEPRVEFLVYSVAGFKAAIEPSAEVTATASTTGGLSAKLEANLDFVFGTAGPLFDLLNIEKELSYNIWERDWPLTTQPFAFKTQPLSRTVAPGDNVSFSCSVESPSPPTFQWYQNGRVLPSQTSRSLFLDRVATGYAGNYFVRVKAGNQSIDSEIATLTVQTVTPETLDTDRDGISDIYETNTGTWVSSTNRGTDPFDWDSDDDGLSDGVENRSFSYVSRRNTGSDPNLPDTDADGVNDKTEIDQGKDPNRGVRPQSNIATIAAGDTHSLFIKSDETLWAMGYNNSGELGDGTRNQRTSPVQVAAGVAQVAAGIAYGLFLKTDGTLWSMGSNFFGVLGDGTTETRVTPVQVATGVAQIFAGGFSSLFVKSDGTLWAMGLNDFDELGDGTTVNRTTPVQVATGVTQAVAGGSHSLFVRTDGTLWAIGNNRSGRLGDGTTVNRTTPVQVATGVTQAAAGSSHSLFVKTDGTLWAMGNNDYGQLGDRTEVSRSTPVLVANGVSQISAGTRSSHYVKNDGTLWMMGWNYFGSYDDDNSFSETSSTPVQVATGVRCFTQALHSQRSPETDHLLYVKLDGTLWGLGYNNFGQLGIVTMSDIQPIPIQIATGL